MSKILPGFDVPGRAKIFDLEKRTDGAYRCTMEHASIFLDAFNSKKNMSAVLGS